jgi:RNA polymerase sigma-70 factor (ECF subfamily)
MGTAAMTPTTDARTPSRQRAFDDFYAATVRRVIHGVYAFCGDLAEAQDLAQEAYARAWQRWSRVSTYDSPEAWVRNVAWRLAANRWRRLRRWPRARTRLGPAVPSDGPTPDRVAVIAALRRLPPAQRRVVVLHYLYDLPVADVATSAEMPEGTVKVYLARARARLAALLQEEPASGADGTGGNRSRRPSELAGEAEATRGSGSVDVV